MAGLTLTGVVIAGDHAVAVIRDRANTRRELQVGDRLGPWRVSAIDAASVRLEADAATGRLLLDPEPDGGGR
jgi:hypothetical protein